MWRSRYVLYQARSTQNQEPHIFSTVMLPVHSRFLEEEEIITAGVYGRNEVPNTKSEAVMDKVRNAAVALGAILGASRVQWESLVHGILMDCEKVSNPLR